MCQQGFVDRVPNLTLTFNPVTQINKAPPFIINNLHVKTWKVIWQKLLTVLCQQSFIDRVPNFTMSFDPVNQNQ